MKAILINAHDSDIREVELPDDAGWIAAAQSYVGGPIEKMPDSFGGYLMLVNEEAHLPHMTKPYGFVAFGLRQRWYVNGNALLVGRVQRSECTSTDILCAEVKQLVRWTKMEADNDESA